MTSATLTGNATWKRGMHAMTPVPHYAWLQVEQRDEVTVLRIAHRSGLEEEAFDIVRRRVAELLEAGQRRFVLGFGGIESLNTYMLAKLFKLHQTIVAAGGQLVLCQAGPFLTEIFKIVGLPAIIGLYGPEDEAVQAVAHADTC